MSDDEDFEIVEIVHILDDLSQLDQIDLMYEKLGSILIKREGPNVEPDQPDKLIWKDTWKMLIKNMGGNLDLRRDLEYDEHEGPTLQDIDDWIPDDS